MRKLNKVIYFTGCTAIIAYANTMTGDVHEVCTSILSPGMTVYLMPEKGDRPAKSLLVRGQPYTSPSNEEKIESDLANVLKAKVCKTLDEYESAKEEIAEYAAKQKESLDYFYDTSSIFS